MKEVVIISVTSFICVFTFGFVFNYFYKKVSYKAIIKRKQELLRIKKKKLHDTLEELHKSPNEIENIINMNVRDLLSAIDTGLLKPLDILRVYQIKALLMDLEYNFITDLNPNAEDDANNFSRKGKLLQGIPISVKDVFYLKDCDCTFGMPSLCFKPAIQDSTVVQSLRMQGAIPFVMTNMSQTGISIECSNPIFGSTLNPHNKRMTCGGSSGGEGAILGSGGSIIGIGNDIGGSVRIPAAYCGVFGLKPTSDRISHRHTIPLYPDQNFINVSIGPLARRFEDLVILFKAMVNENLSYLDPHCPPLGFNEKLYEVNRPLRIGYYSHFGESQVMAIPAVVRAVKLAKKALESAGHTLIEFTIPDIDYAMNDLYLKSLFTDGGYGYINQFIQSNPIDSSLFLTVMLLRMPNILKKIVSYILYPFNKNYSLGLYALTGVPSVYRLWELKDKLEAYKEKVLSKWESERLDGLICPVLPVTAMPCQTTQYVMDIISYTAIYNILDYPAGSVPVTRVNEGDIKTLVTSYPRNSPTHKQIIELQKNSASMPVGVQCVSMKWREEMCLRIMGDIVKNL